MTSLSYYRLRSFFCFFVRMSHPRDRRRQSEPSETIAPASETYLADGKRPPFSRVFAHVHRTYDPLFVVDLWSRVIAECRPTVINRIVDRLTSRYRSRVPCARLSIFLARGCAVSTRHGAARGWVQLVSVDRAEATSMSQSPARLSFARYR